MMNIDPRSVELPRPPPRIAQVCACGAVLRRMTRASGGSFYFWFRDGRMDPRRSFRSEDVAARRPHCDAEYRFINERLMCIGYTRGFRPHRYLPHVSDGRECVLCGNWKEQEERHAS